MTSKSMVSGERTKHPSFATFLRRNAISPQDGTDDVRQGSWIELPIVLRIPAEAAALCTPSVLGKPPFVLFLPRYHDDKNKPMDRYEKSELVRYLTFA